MECWGAGIPHTAARLLVFAYKLWWIVSNLLQWLGELGRGTPTINLHEYDFQVSQRRMQKICIRGGGNKIRVTLHGINKKGHSHWFTTFLLLIPHSKGLKCWRVHHFITSYTPFLPLFILSKGSNTSLKISAMECLHSLYTSHTVSPLPT